MSGPLHNRHLPAVQAALRIAAGLAYFSHGAAKSLGWFGAEGTAELMSRWGAAGVIETTAGALLILGLFTRWAAFIAAGEMAVAYFWIHSGGDSSIWWWQNGGEVVMLFSFIWLLFAVWGGGPVSLDGWRERRAFDRDASLP